MTLALVAAVARNGVIGHDNALLWHLPEDLRHFRMLTQGAPVIMGRRTWESLPEKFRPLPGRRNIVVTRDPHWQAEGATPASSLEHAIALAADAPRSFVIGGATLYAAALRLADELLLTEIERDFEGDTRFPPWRRDEFAELSRERHVAAAPNGFAFSFVAYRRSAAASPAQAGHKSTSTSNPP